MLPISQCATADCCISEWLLFTRLWWCKGFTRNYSPCSHDPPQVTSQLLRCLMRELSSKWKATVKTLPQSIVHKQSHVTDFSPIVRTLGSLLKENGKGRFGLTVGTHC
eukprot:5117357-Amphidinium_carterae.3